MTHFLFEFFYRELQQDVPNESLISPAGGFTGLVTLPTYLAIANRHEKKKMYVEYI